MMGTDVMSVQIDQQLTYEAYSYYVQGLFELLDGLSLSAQVFVDLDKQNEFRIPAAVREVSGVVDAYFFNLINLFPANSSYSSQAANQKSQVDTHFRQAVHAFHLVTAQSATPYSNVTSEAVTME
ncbi:hypothetical protein K402DRAFT_410560 [Aulographum hederae CBS 113979]|uniref:Uncharacterized protein n=1 Tax=Aulographum hederae CBS 113979 TaxID=1176131 RepID=A0A6G1H9L8_9PEZI|nr:hypothetical protein K402DRAFT_410560 [Aulographum hederae CBS 113979]